MPEGSLYDESASDLPRRLRKLEQGRRTDTGAMPPQPTGAVHQVAYGCKPLKLVAGACFGATKTDVVCFSLDRILEPMAIPAICGNGHLLTPDTRWTKRNVAGAADAAVGRERPNFGRGICRRHRWWSMNDRVIQADADS